MNKFRSKTFLIILANVSVSSMAFSTCLDTVVKEEKKDICLQSKGSKLTTIDAESYIPSDTGVWTIGGGVCISMGEQRIVTQELFYDDPNQIVTIESELTYSDGNQQMDAQSAKINLEKEEAILSDVYYQINASNANGKAREIKTDKKISQLKGLTYSTCPKNDQQWFIQAQSADLDQENQVGTFRKMTLRFKGVPLLYLPYAKMPLSDKRQSGFLIPEINNSSINGFELAIPYYVNIAENMDATITPRIITERGAMLAAEFRYMGDNYKGEIYADYLASDKIEKKDRGYIEYSHKQTLNAIWALNARLSNVSDNQYFEDFGNNNYFTAQSYLYSHLNIKGSGENWLFKGTVDDFQIISENIALNRQPYQSLPNLEYSWFNNNYSSTLNYGLDSQWISLYREESITAKRLDVMPYIEKSFQNNFSRFTPKLAYRHTNWDYSNADFSSISALKTSRSIPIASLDYTLNFEKQFSDGGFSTIEPRLFYLYSSYEDQQNIPLFDTHELTFGSGLLYQSNAFSGADRQSDANQVSLGVTQRHFDQSGIEKWNFTLGQIAYFEDRKVQLDETIETRTTSPIISEINYFYDNWKATLSVHWDTVVDKSERALFKIQHKGKNNSLFNFAYRFRQGKIEQLDSSVVLPIGVNNRFIARWNYSMDENKTIEAVAGFEHKNCCWATRVVGRRYVYNEQGDVNNGIFFELQLNGLGSIGRNPRRLLKQSILGYSEEF